MGQEAEVKLVRDGGSSTQDVDRRAVVPKTRERHFGGAESDPTDVDALKAEIAELGKAVRRLQRRLAK